MTEPFPHFRIKMTKHMSGKGPPNKGRLLSCDASNTTAPFGIFDDSFLRGHVTPYAIECSSSLSDGKLTVQKCRINFNGKMDHV
jgi:hypothetical protein